MGVMSVEVIGRLRPLWADRRMSMMARWHIRSGWRLLRGDVIGDGTTQGTQLKMVSLSGRRFTHGLQGGKVVVTLFPSLLSQQEVFDEDNRISSLYGLVYVVAQQV